jgi:hypothetical protein
MKYEVTNRYKMTTLPNVGQAWMLPGGKEVFVRIPDHQGVAALGVEMKNVFYSISLTNGHIVWMDRDTPVVVVELTPGASFQPVL